MTPGLILTRSGEEITVSYMSPLTRSGFTSSKLRRKILFDEFGFDCGCKACTKHPDELENRGRERIVEVTSLTLNVGINSVTII